MGGAPETISLSGAAGSFIMLDGLSRRNNSAAEGFWLLAAAASQNLSERNAFSLLDKRLGRAGGFAPEA